MSQCQLCLSYIREIKQMSEQIKVKGILLNEQEKNHKAQIEGLQRHIDALKSFLLSKGIMINEGEEKELLELNMWTDDTLKIKDREEKGLKDYPHSVVWDEDDYKYRLGEDYDYMADDRNFDAAREREVKG